MKKFIESLNLNLFILIVLTISLRLFNLGYSDFQGDEIKALYLPEPTQNFITFVLDQRKGPLQFVVTYLLKFVDPLYKNQLLMRLPFALANIFAVYFFYQLVKLLFGKRAGFYAALLMSVSGFIVAFGRIVQYQSFVLLLMVLALYQFALALKYDAHKYLGIFFGFLFWTFSILFHYDGVFIAPFAFYFISQWFFKYVKADKKAAKTLVFSLLLSGLLLAGFYVPFILTLSRDTIGYWQLRIEGEVGKKASSLFLFDLYQPILAKWFYLALSLFGTIIIYIRVFGKKLPDLKLNSLSEKIWGLDNKSSIYLFLTAWFLMPFLFLEVYVAVPGTHIYTYLMPLFIVMGIGVDGLLNFLETRMSKKYLIYPFYLFAALFSVFLYIQSFWLFIDNSVEYPWSPKKFWFWTLPTPSIEYNLSIFGFPYYRNWEGISDFTKQYPEIGAYSTNEKKAISGYFISLPKNADSAGFYVQIEAPQSFSSSSGSNKASYWMQKYEPIFTLTRSGVALVRVYIMQPGDLLTIQSEGY